MESKFERILAVLNDLLKEEDVLAVRVSALSGGNLSPPPEKLKIKNMGVWNMVNNSVNEAFAIFGKFDPYGIDKMYLELGDYEIIFFKIDRKTLLISVIPALANKGLLEVEIENTRRDIAKIMSADDKSAK